LSVPPLVLTPVRTLRTIPASPDAYAAQEETRKAGGIGPAEWAEASLEIEERAEAEDRAAAVERGGGDTAVAEGADRVGGGAADGPRAGPDEA